MRSYNDNIFFMKLLNRNIIFFSCLIVLLLIFPERGQAQLGIGGTPPSFKYKNDTYTRSGDNINNIYIPFSYEDLQADDRLNEEEANPPRIAELISANLDMQNSGVWKDLPGGEHIWQLHIRAEGAKALILYYRNFKLPEGGRLFVYNPDHTQILGAFTRETNPFGGKFVTEFTAGDEVILEYVAPENWQNSEKPVLELEEIGYGYNFITIRNNESEEGDLSSSCMVDINCEEGDNWQEEKRGVVKIIMRIGTGTYLCTGTVMNNTAADFIPYILTAHHCLVSSSGTASSEDLAQTLFYFNYERQRCGVSTINTAQTMKGCSLITSSSIDGGVDEALLRLSENIPDSLNVYYNGWDREDTNIPQKGVSIHHPKGDVKKISTYTQPATSDTWNTKENTGMTGGHWLVRFAATPNGHGVTEKGSSGAPLYNHDKLVCGTLTGGDSKCENPNGRNLYGKLAYFWEKCAQYLDPLQKGVKQLNGRYAVMPKPIPENLHATFDNESSTVTLTWDPPVSEDEQPVSYRIYRNYYPVKETESLSFSENYLALGLYYYSVAAIYEDNTVSATTDPITISVYEFPKPEISETKRSDDHDISIFWKNPIFEQEIYWGTNEPIYRVKISNNKPFYFGQSWDINDLKPIKGYTIRSIQFYPFSGCTYSVYIRQGERIYTQKIKNPVIGHKNSIPLEEPFVIEENSELYITLKAENYTNSPAAVDNMSCIDWKGNIFSTDGNTWSSLYSNQPKNNFNFAVSATVSSLKPDTPVSQNIKTATSSPSHNYAKSDYNIIVTKESQLIKTNTGLPIITSSIPVGNPRYQWNIWRDGTKLNQSPLKETFFTDKGLIPGTYNYALECVYPENSISLMSSYQAFTLSDKSFAAGLTDISIEEEGIIISKIDDKVYFASCPCDLTSVTINVQASEGASLSIDGIESPRYIFTFDHKGGSFNIPIVITSESGERTETYTLSLLKLAEQSVVQRWNDVLAVITNPENNGGLNFSSYAWYRNDELLAGETKPYLSLPAGSLPNDAYRVEITTKEGLKLLSCEKILNTFNSLINVYPTQVRAGQSTQVYISPECGDLSKCQIFLISTSGRIEKQIVPTETITTVIVPDNAGNYIIRVITSDNKKTDIKIICTP